MNTLFAALHNFLPAGTLTFSITPNHADVPLISSDVPQHAADGYEWAAFPPNSEFPGYVVRPAEFGLLDNFCFLVRHRFVAATYHVDTVHARLYVRVYIIPWDLPGSKGVLRTRDEDTVLRPGRRRLKALFLQLRQDKSMWEANPASTSSPPQHFWENVIDNRSLLDIYNDLPSPAPDTLLDDIPGLRSDLYAYQRRTVSTMVARESLVGPVPDPLYLPLRGIDGKVFYMQPATMEIVAEQPRISPVPGGILCEELGTGKTIMALSLILATLNDMSAPEEAFHEERIPMTPLALRHFQTASASSARAKLSKNKKFPQIGVPSLVELMIHQCRVTPNLLALREQQERLEQRNLWASIHANVPFYLHRDIPRDTGWGAKRGAEANAPKVMYLTTATLVIVPDNLQIQWANEILKHCTELLRVLVVRQKDELPDAPLLATDYDVILLNHSRFSKEAQKKNVAALTTMKQCQCSQLRESRVPLCTCSRRANVSPLLQVRWKRLIVDEGHIAATKRTEYAVFTKLLSVERRWIVTGTPTTNLLGLNFGSGSDLQYPEDDEEDEQVNALRHQRCWHPSERDDFRKLGVIFADFLMMKPFPTDRSFSSSVSDPIFDAGGPWPGGITVLTQVMASVMVRHRIDDVEQDIRLPFLQHDTVLLDMDPYAVKTYNLIQATIAVNAVDSERKDQDYLFHPRNAAHLQETVSNVSHTLFWHVVDTHLDERLSNAERSLANLEKRDGSKEDYELIKQSLFHMRAALDDPVWVALQEHYYVFHRIEHIPAEIADAWSMLSPQAFHIESLMPPTRLTQLRDFLFRHPRRPMSDIVNMGLTVAEEDRKWKEYSNLQDHLRKKGQKERRSKDSVSSDVSTTVRRANAEKKLKEMFQEYKAAAARLTAASTGEGAVTAPKHADANQRRAASMMLRQSPAAGVRVRNSTSTKLDYILNEVLLYNADEKFLIFSESPATLSFISDALDLIGVKSLLFGGKLKREERQALVTTFETSELYRVLLMELKHGARGLNLVSASRVIFCEPVWKADVESQAIKRVHRIGQSRRVIVKTLAIRGTSEEIMVNRTKALKDSKQEFSKEVTDDRTIRDFIEHPTFLPIPTERLVDLNVPLFPFADPPQPGVISRPVVEVEDVPAAPPIVRSVKIVVPPSPRRSSVYVEIASQPPTKKRRTVTFVE